MIKSHSMPYELSKVKWLNRMPLTGVNVHFPQPLHRVCQTPHNHKFTKQTKLLRFQNKPSTSVMLPVKHAPLQPEGSMSK